VSTPPSRPDPEQPDLKVVLRRIREIEEKALNRLRDPQRAGRLRALLAAR